ncbi:polysaccharide deacetylase family protein [Myroides marinus]|uniref:polysaccharide deacetylase family protein n=1 Tax=Myroides marinus TaxID=703342 RepID=UPI002575834E|nr:polysaccharide deacetylase family protein [Myroides marinus]MDM1367480.1 polysaccharide deacetylase family protein [Myroides marinus]MDM1370928.1 polysaccharide deacetylase family protein [Myroides marinus]MDM1373979.1 polysaccharide deacetylase family protein [Myroides marinus]MDM1383001.1 polysaccharide deacetylase family protein [Myroides marinus]MDM1388452.1 polysaccharide deacetylase family protein [Myroides marinus]
MLRFKVINSFGILYFTAVVILIYTHHISAWWLVLGGLLWVGMLAWGAFDIRLNIFVKAISSKRNERQKRIAITFDDGPTLFTPMVLELLSKYNAKATFFCIGNQVQQYPSILQQTLAEGHLIGNHTQTHTTRMGFLSADEVYQEIILAEQTIQNTIGIRPMWYRPPFGVTNPKIAKALSKTDYKIAGWNIRSLDTVIEKEQRIFERIKHKIKPGAIILLHDTTERSVQALELLLIELTKQGYEMVTLDELLNH